MAASRSQRRGPWIPEEDQRLLTLVSSQGAHNWVRIAANMELRTPKQCRERYHQNLKPSLNHEPISPEEGAVIEKLVYERGKRWAEIARILGNRSDNAVKNWWNGSQNRRKRNAIQREVETHSKAFGNRIDPRTGSRPAQPLPRIHHGDVCLTDHDSRWTRSYHRDSEYPMSPPNEYNERVRSRQDYLPPWTDTPSSVESKDRYPPVLTPPNLGSVFPEFQTPGIDRPQSLRISPQQSRDRLGHHRLPPMLPGPASRTFEAPLVSPASTEVSQAPSMDRAPSLMSDHSKTSSTSVSPKTMSSPRPEGLHPIDTSDARQAQSIRRGSAPCLQRSCHPQSFNCDEGYVSAQPVSGSTEKSYWNGPLPMPSQHRHQYSRSDTTSALPRSDSSRNEVSPTSTKDQRMNVRDLLN